MNTESTQRKRIAVIGGGAAGLAAAWRLSSPGRGGTARDIVLYDAAAETGGLLRTDPVPTAGRMGVRVDSAVQLVSSTYTRLFALAAEAGARELLVRASGRDALWRKQSAQEITYGNVASMATSGALPTMLKLKLATKYVPFLTMSTGSLDANDPAHTGGEKYDRESIAAWGTREISEDFVEYLTYPLLAAYYGSPPERTSAAMYHALARVGMEVQVYAVRGGMGALAAAITSALQVRGVVVRRGVEVSVIQPSPEHQRWIVQAGSSMQAVEEFDGIIVATPPDEAARLVGTAGGATTHVAQWLSSVQSHPASTVGIAIGGVMRSPYFGLSFPRRGSPGDRIVAVTSQHNKPAGIVPQGMSALTVFPAPSVAERVASMSSAEALAFIAPSLERAYPGIMKRVTGSAVFNTMRYRDMEPGFIRRIQQLEDIALPPGLAIAGDYTMAPTVEGAVRSGERAADRFYPDFYPDHHSGFRS